MNLHFAAYAPLVMYFGGIVVFFLSVFWKPQIGLYFLVPLLPMQTVRYWIHGYPLGEKIVDIILLGIILGIIFHGKSPKMVASPMNKVLVIFFVLTYIGLWLGAFYIGSELPIFFDDVRFSDWKNYVEMMILFFVAAACIRTPRQMQIIVVLMCFSVLVVNRSYHGTVGDRDFSAYSDALRDAGALGYAGENGMGAFQAQFAVFLIGLAAFSKNLVTKLALWGVTVTSIYCLMVTLSRGGYLGFLFGIFIIGVIKERKLLILLTILLVGWQGFVPNAVRERVLMTYSQGEGLDSSAEERIGLWQDALTVFNHNPVLGTGFDTYKFMGRVGPYRDTHNYYVKILLELGFAGIVIFLWLLATAGKMSWKLFRTSKDPTLNALGCAFFAMLACAGLVNFFGDRWTYLQVNGFFWVLLGLVARGLQIVKEEQTVEEVVPEGIGVVRAAAPKISHA
jgi:putative inorganic carbon (HCO3(-)) transporter